MKGVTGKQMQAIEEAAFARGVSAAGLMVEAGSAIARSITGSFPTTGLAIAFLGKGNNGGDALVALKKLRAVGWKLAVRLEHPIEELSPLAKEHLCDLGQEYLYSSKSLDELVHSSSHPIILLDGLVGIGAKGPLRQPLAELAEEMKRLQGIGAIVYAMDIPSGVDTDTGEVYPCAVIADVTCSVALPKIGILQSSAVNHVGGIDHLPLRELQTDENSDVELITPSSWDKRYRNFDFHKGMAGRVGILAGSPGMLGAACIAARGALLAGAGLVTIFCPESIFEAMSIKAPDEVMVSLISNSTETKSFENLHALVIGPGLGSPQNAQSTSAELTPLILKLFNSTRLPVLIDADGLNLLATTDLLGSLSEDTILTPHPGEMLRLYPQAKDESSREETIENFCKESPATILFKGARTLIKKQGSPCYVNGRGHAGMATAGQGDLLSGVIGALRAQGYNSLHASCMGAWICGRASELASIGSAKESLTTSQTASYIPRALQKWQSR